MLNEQFSLPPEVSYKKELLPQGGMAYVFRHTALGELGRLLVLPLGEKSHIACEMVGDAEDSMTAKRLAILEPITIALNETLENTYGKSTPLSPPVLAPGPKDACVPSKILACATCGAPVGLLVFAVGARSPGELEDTARLMYPNIIELDVSTWIIGEEDTVGDGWARMDVKNLACSRRGATNGARRTRAAL